MNEGEAHAGETQALLPPAEDPAEEECLEVGAAGLNYHVCRGLNYTRCRPTSPVTAAPSSKAPGDADATGGRGDHAGHVCRVT